MRPGNDPPSVREIYESIAPFFARRRTGPWPPMVGFLEEVSPCKVLDIGCGTGRGLLLASSLGCEVIGIDISPSQLGIASETLRNAGFEADLIETDMRHIPVPDGIADATMMIASLHHLPDRNARAQTLREAARVTRKGGKALISVWTWDQERFRERHLSRAEGSRGSDESDGPLPGDFFVPWKDGRIVQRFYHLYGPDEIENEAKEAGWDPTRSYFDGRNHWLECALLR